jgi:hypothetical protein
MESIFDETREKPLKRLERVINKGVAVTEQAVLSPLQKIPTWKENPSLHGNKM